MEGSNAELTQSKEENEELPQYLSSQLINGLIDGMKAQFNSQDNQQKPATKSELVVESALTEAEDSILTDNSDKRRGKRQTVKSIIDIDKHTTSCSTPSCSKDSDETDESSPRITRNNFKEINLINSPSKLKKSNQRRGSSREFSDSVVKNAIARKEMSFSQNIIEHTRRPSRPLKPTQKVLENLAAASQKRGSKIKEKFLDESETDKKVSKRSRNAPKNGKKIKLDETDESFNSDDEKLSELSKSPIKNYVDFVNTRRSQRLSSASKKDDDSPEKSTDSMSKLSIENLTASEQLILSRICLCTTKTDIFVKKDKDTVYCEALDNIDGKVIGCSRTLNCTKVSAVRPSSRIPYSLYCLMHRERLKKHNCCPTCGIFCTQGIFCECVNKHQYHTECHMIIGEKICCPHCGLSMPTRNVRLTLECDQMVITDSKYITKQSHHSSLANLLGKESPVKQNTSNSSHVIDCNDVTDSSTDTASNQSDKFINVPEDDINIIQNTTVETSKTNLINDIPTNSFAKNNTKNPKQLSKESMDTASSSIDVNINSSNGLTSLIVSKMTGKSKNLLEVSSVMNLIPIRNLEQQNDEFNMRAISDSILREKYGQLRYILEKSIPTKTSLDLCRPFAYPAHLSPFSSCPSPTNDSNRATIVGTILHYACALGRTHAVRIIVRYMSDDVKQLLQLLDSEQNTPLSVALASGRNECARTLLHTGLCNVNVRGGDGMSPLHTAARSGNLLGCELLLNHVAQVLPHASHSYLNSPDDGGWTALIWASEHAHADVVALLLARGADRMRRDVEHNMAVHWACYAGHVGVLNVLLEGQGDGGDREGAWKLQMVNAVNIQGDTPLHLAAHQSHTGCITQLLEHGAEPDSLNKMHETPFDLLTDPESEAHRIITKHLQCHNIIKVSTNHNCPEEERERGKDDIVVDVVEKRHEMNVGGEIVLNGGSKLRQQVLLNNDVTRGRETNPIQLINSIDTTPEPRDYCYITSCCLTTDNVRIDTRITSLRHCNCSAANIVSCLTYLSATDDDDDDGGETLPCQCLDGTKVWYDVSGRLVKEFNFQDPPTIFECNDRCSCNSLTCGNRVVQKNGSLMIGSIRTQVFRTKNRGWSLRTLQNISQGSYVCEYVGEVLNDKDVDARLDDSYVFDLDSTDSEMYCIDAKFYGNMSRFINHSCEPNLVPVKVFTNHQDLRFPRIAFFANRNIRANDELSFDYGEKFWIIKYKTFTCQCGTKNCKYSEDTIAATLDRYYKAIVDTCNGQD